MLFQQLIEEATATPIFLSHSKNRSQWFGQKGKAFLVQDRNNDIIYLQKMLASGLVQTLFEIHQFFPCYVLTPTSYTAFLRNML